MHRDDNHDRAADAGRTDPEAPRERVTDRDWTEAGGDPDASPVLGGTSSHQRPSFNDPAAGNPDPIIGTSGLAAEKAAGMEPRVARPGDPEEWIENPIDQGGFGVRASDDEYRDSDAARREDEDEAQ